MNLLEKTLERKKRGEKQTKSRSGSVGRKKVNEHKMRYTYDKIRVKIVLLICTEQGSQNCPSTNTSGRNMQQTEG